VAKIRAEADLKKAEIAASVDMQEAKMEQDRDTIYVQSEMQRAGSEHQARMAELQLKLQIAQLDYATKRQISLDEAKVKLATDSMKLRTTRELAGIKASADMMPKPPVEPPQRAPAGQSFQQ
jgi:hypothetical protein